MESKKMSDKWRNIVPRSGLTWRAAVTKEITDQPHHEAKGKCG